MRVRVALILTILGLAMAVTAGPVTAGGGSLVIGPGDGELGSGFLTLNGGTTWGAQGCRTGGVPVGADTRFALEFPLSGLPVGANVTGATLSLHMWQGSFTATQAIYGYAGDGAIALADIQVAGTPLAFTPTTDSAREDHDVTAMLTAGVVGSGWAGFSVREEPDQDTFNLWDCPGADTFPPELDPILTITYDLPNPAATNLPNAAMATPESTSPLATLGFAALLIAALGTLAVVSSRRAVSRR